MPEKPMQKLNIDLIQLILFILGTIFWVIAIYLTEKHPRPKTFISDIKDTFQQAKKGDIFSILMITSLAILALFMIAAYITLLVALMERL